jgi:hypothetical protein
MSDRLGTWQMALPKNVETPRGLELQAKLKTAMAADQSLKDWPMPTKDDYVVIGGVIVLFSYAEFNLRRLAEAFDHAGLLPDPWKGRARVLDIGQVDKAVQADPVWSGPADVEALKTLADLRRLRNLVAHFVVRRFPSDEAFLFIAKNAKDYEREFGAKPAPGVSMTAVVEREQVVNALRHIEHIQNWLAQVAPEFEKRLFPAPNPPVMK